MALGPKQRSDSVRDATLVRLLPPPVSVARVEG